MRSRHAENEGSFQAYASPSSVYRVLAQEGRLDRWNQKPSKKGTGFAQPLRPHDNWHIDISYLNLGGTGSGTRSEVRGLAESAGREVGGLCTGRWDLPFLASWRLGARCWGRAPRAIQTRGTFYHLCSVLDGASRAILQWEIRESMKEPDVELVLQRAREQYPNVRPRIISDNGSQFIALDFKKFIRLTGMTHWRTSPGHPQSNPSTGRIRVSLVEMVEITPLVVHVNSSFQTGSSQRPQRSGPYSNAATTQRNTFGGGI